jgi:hypothetical protein
MKTLILSLLTGPSLFAQEAELTVVGTTWWSRNRFNFSQKGMT